MDAIQHMRDALNRARAQEKPIQVAEDAVALFHEAASYIAALQEVQAEAKTLLDDLLTETGVDEIKTSMGKCYRTQPAQLIRYDAKGLDELRSLDSEFADLLAPYRTESTRRGSIHIRTAQ